MKSTKTPGRKRSGKDRFHGFYHGEEKRKVGSINLAEKGKWKLTKNARKKRIYATRVRITVPPFHRVYKGLHFLKRKKKDVQIFFEGFYPPRGGSIRGFFAVGSKDGSIADGRDRSRLRDMSVSPSVRLYCVDEPKREKRA